MERADRLPVGARRPAGVAQAARTSAAQAMADLRPTPITQRAVDSSPAMTAQRRALDSAFGPIVQRQGDEELQMKTAPGTAQLQGDEELQMKVAPGVAQLQGDEELQMKTAGPTAQREAAPSAPDNSGMPGGLRSSIEALSGVSMEGVKVHYNSSQPAQLNALAYAQGSDIHLAPGQEQHLPHEAWHVVQQAQGRVQPTMQMQEGVPVNDDAGLEREADVMGAKAAER